MSGSNALEHIHGYLHDDGSIFTGLVMSSQNIYLGDKVRAEIINQSFKIIEIYYHVLLKIEDI